VGAEALDAGGLIARAVIEDPERPESLDRPPLRPVVCVGRIIDHQKNPDGTYHIALAGICRAEIVEEDESDFERLYRQARLSPLNSDEPPSEDDLATVREMLEKMIESERFPEFTALKEQMVDWSSIPTSALLDVACAAVCSAVADPDFAYAMLAEASIFERAAAIEHEVDSIERLHRVARRQYDADAPKGITWN